MTDAKSRRGLEAVSARAFCIAGAAIVALCVSATLVRAADAIPPLPDRRPAPPAAETAPRAPAPAAKPAPASTLPPLPVDQKSVPWTDQEVKDARDQCDALLGKLNVVYAPMTEIKEGACGAPAPILVKSIDGIDIDPPATIRCPLAAALHEWFTKVVQPEAKADFGARVVKVVQEASYDCRNRYGARVGLLSQHALADAIDISEYRLSTGKEIVQAESWPKVLPKSHPEGGGNKLVEAAAKTPLKATDTDPPLPDPNPELNPTAKPGGMEAMRVAGRKVLAALRGDASAAQSDHADDTPSAGSGGAAADAAPDKAGLFLVHIHDGACPYFGTVLGPGANAAHQGHFHLDMTKRRTDFCQ